MKLSIKVKLLLSDTESALLKATVAAYTRTFNRICQSAWNEKIPLGQVHQRTYYEARESEPQLPAQLVISAIGKAKETVKAGRTRLRQKRKATCPVSKRQTIRYDARSSWVRLADETCSLLTIQGRIKPRFKGHRYLAETLLRGFELADGSTLTYCERTHHWYLVLTLSCSDACNYPLSNVVGVDLGQRNLAVTSTGKFFKSAKRNQRSSRYRKLTEELSAKGTRSAKAHLKRTKGRWQRFQADVNHCVSKQVVQSLKPNDAIAMEDLAGIRETTKHRKAQRAEFHNWSFYQLQQFITYKAHQNYHPVCWVDPAYTSQTCPKCGHREKGNRPNQSTFRCKQCGFEDNADLVGARNIRQRAIDSLPTGTLASAAIIQPKGGSPDVRRITNAQAIPDRDVRNLRRFDAWSHHDSLSDRPIALAVGR